MASNLRKRKETQKVKSAGGQVIHTADRTASGAVAPHQQRESNPDVREAFRKRVQESIGADMTAGVRGVLPPAQREFDRTEAVKRRQSNKSAAQYMQAHPEQDWRPYAPKGPQRSGWMQEAPNQSHSLGQFGRGNVDLYNRPQYRNPDGSISTVRSISIGTDEGEVLIPTIGVDADGKPVSWTDDEAIDHYYKTDEHLGKFKSVEEADRYAEQLHKQQEDYYTPNRPQQYTGYMQWGTKDSPEFNALARLAQQAGAQKSKRYGDYMKDSAEAMGRKIDLPGFGMRYPGLAAQEYGKQHSDLDADTEYIRNKRDRNLSGASDAVRPGEEGNEIFKGRGILAPNDRILQNAMLSDEQKRTYNYIYATQGAEEAEKFRDTALEEGGVNAMIAQKAFDADLRNSGYPGKLAATYIGGVEGAADSLAGVSGMVKGEEQYRPRSTAEYFTSEAVRSEPEGSLARTGLELAQSAGTNTLAHLASVAGGPALGSAVFAAQAGARAYNESLMEGHTVGEATAYGAMQALDEEITNYLLGGLSAYGGGAVQRTLGRTRVAQMVGKTLTDIMKTEGGKYAMRQLMDAFASNSGEAAQEYLQHFTEEFEKWVAYNHTGYDLTTPEGRAALANDMPTRQQIAASLTDPEALHEALIGFLNAGIMNAPGQITEAADIMSRGRNSDIGSMGYGAFADAIDVNPLNYSNPDTYHEARDLRNLAQEYEHRNTAGMPTSTFDRGIIDRAAYEFAAHAAEDPRQMRLADTGEEYAQESEPAYAQETEPAAEAVTESVRPISDIYGDYLARKAEYGAKKAQNDQAMSEALAGTFGKEGKKAFAEMPAERSAEAYREFAAYYNSERFGTQAPAEAQTLTPEQVTAAMKAGALDANAAYPADTMKATARSAQRIQVDGVSAGVADRSGINYDALTPQQKLRVDFTDAYITKGLGMDVRYIQSDAVNGNYEGINGSFSVVNGRPTITLDVNAGMNKVSDWTGDVTDMQTMLPVISHEITHFLEKSAPEAYKAISDAVIKSLANNRGYTGGYTINQIVRAEINRMDRTEKGADGKPIKHTEADALHEIVARACEDMLSGDTKAVQAFETLDTQTKATLWDHIKSVFDNIREFFQQMLSSYKSDSAEAKAIRQNMDEFEKIRSMWQEALNGGTTTVSASEANTTQVETAKEAFSVRQFANSLDFDVRLTGEGQAYEIIDPKTGKAVKHVTPKMMEQTPMGVLVQAAFDAGTINKKTANRQLKMFSDLMNLTLKYDPGSTSMVWEIAGTYLFSSVKTNSDKQYSTTIDYGTICAKTQALIDVLSKTMVQKGRGLTREEVLTAYNKTAGVGLSVPCPVCYVFSRWMGVPSLLETMRKCQDRFSNASEKEVQDYIKSMLDEYKTAKGVNEAKTKVQNRLATLERRLQEALENGDSKAQEDVRKEVSELEKKMSDLESFNWVTQVRCVGDKNGNYKLDKGYRPVPNEILLDLTKSGDFAKQFPKAWKYRTTRGAGMGKAIVPYSGATLGDFIKGTKDRWASTKNPFFNKNPKAARAAITRAATRARAQNLIGGQRFQSTSDFRAEWGIDYLMTFLECQASGSQVQLYTKVIEAVDMFASAGAEVNLSIMPKGDGYENGRLVFSDITGVNFENALEKTRQYDNVQMILVGINDDHIRMAMADDRITFIIPWHSSGNSKDTLASLMKSVGETLNSANDYSETQNDKIIDNSAEAKAARQLRKDIIQGKLWADYKNRKAAKLTDAQQAILDNNAYLNELYRKFYVDKSAKEYGVKLNGNQSAGIFPYEYWNTSLTIKDADQNGRRFQEYCASLGIQPRFPQFANDPGYWKTLIDRRMYNRDGTYHEPSAIDVTNVKIEQVPQAVNSNNYKDMDKIDQATMDTIHALDDRQSDLAATDDVMPEAEITDERTQYSLRMATEEKSRRGVDHDAVLAELVEKYGALPKGENAQVDVTLPEWTSDTKKTRRYARTVLESGLMTDQMSDEIKEKVIKEALSYEPMTDKDSAEYAASVLRAGGTAKAQKEWDRAKRSDSLNKDDLAVAQFLLKEYANNGDVDNVIKMVEEISAEATRMGQNIQSLRLLKKYAMQAPEVGLGYIQRTVDQMNRDNKRKMGAKYKEMKIDPALAAEYLNAKTSDEIDAALGKIYKNLGSQVQMTGPEAVIDKLRTWRYLSMLGNPRTHVRNFVGNAIFVPAVRLKNVIGAEIEKKAGANRTKALTATPEARAFAQKDALLMRGVLSGKSNMSIRDLIMEQHKVFKTEALNKLSKANSDALEGEDWIFLRMHYQDALAKYITANNMDVNNMDGQKLAQARNYAIKEAQKATYRDANKVSAWLNQSSGAGTVVKYMMEGMLPFKKTPTNILRRGVEYSPAGLIGTLTKGTYDLNSGKITLNEYIDGIASGLSGTAIFGVGMFLASAGLILGGYVDDEDKERRKLRGDQEYAVRIGNHTYTVDWAAPGSLPLFIGVETMYGLKRDHGMTFSDITAAATRLVDPMINMSMLSGLNDTLDAISYSDDKLSAFASETFYSLLGQYVPTISGQIARTIDTTQRINYQDKNTGLSKNMLYFIEKMQNKIPYLTFSNDPYLNEFGQENVTESRFVAAIQNFISPGYISKVKDDRVLDELDRLSEAQDENVLPKKMPKYLGTKEDRVDLTSEQYTTFQRTAGRLSYNIIDNMIDDKRYRQLTAEEQADAISIAYSYAKAAGRIEIQPEYKDKLSGNNKKVYNAVQDGSQAYDVILQIVTSK